MNQKIYYSPAELCEIFDISKSTLFRWEKEKWFLPFLRDKNNQRQYTLDHIRSICKEKHFEKIHRLFAQRATIDDIKGLAETHEELSLQKFISGDRTGLFELSQYRQISSHTILQMLKIAIKHYKPGDSYFCETMKIVAEQSCKILPQE